MTRWQLALYWGRWAPRGLAQSTYPSYQRPDNAPLNPLTLHQVRPFHLGSHAEYLRVLASKRHRRFICIGICMSHVASTIPPPAGLELQGPIRWCIPVTMYTSMVTLFPAKTILRGVITLTKITRQPSQHLGPLCPPIILYKSRQCKIRNAIELLTLRCEWSQLWILQV